MKNFEKMKKRIILITIAVVLFIASTTGVYAASLNNDLQDFATLRVKNKTINGGANTNTGWALSASANPGDTVSFAIYYHNTGPDIATGVRVSLTPQTTTSGGTHSFTAKVWASNAPQVLGTATVILSSSQILSFSSNSVIWRPNQTVWGSLTLPNGQNGSEIFTTNGLLLGDIASGWGAQGSVVLNFLVGGSGGGAPIITTNAATNITQNSATLNCFVNPNGSTNTTRWFGYGTTQSLGSQTSVVSHGNTASNITKYISGLAPNTNYYFRCSARNSNGTTDGNIVSFSTSAGNQIPSVTTYSADSPGTTFAVLNGYVNPNGNTNVSRWFEYGTNSWSLSNSTVKLGQGSSASRFNETVTGLNSGTTYYYRAVAKSGTSGNIYGSVQSFHTNSSNTGQRPFVTTNTATVVNQNSATLNGYVNPYNNWGTTRWFEYGITQSLGSKTNTINHGSTATSISDTISSLLNNTTYYYRVVAQNSYGTTYGSILSFRTGNGNSGTNPPIAITNLATNIDQNSARLNGLAIVNGGNVTTSGWFEWGTSQSLGNTTPTRTLGASSSMSARSSRFGLYPNTTYYYRFVAQNRNGISRGIILNFRTNSVYVPPVVSKKTRNISIMKTVENLDSSNGTGTRVGALRGEKARFTITIENTGDYVLQDVVIRDRIPFYLEFANADEVNTNNPQREVVWDVGNLNVGERQSVILDVIITGSARVGDVIDNVARVESKRLTQNSNVVSIEVTDKINKVSSVAAASFFSGFGGFLPNTLIEWLLLIILIFALVLLSRKLYATNGNGENGNGKA